MLEGVSYGSGQCTALPQAYGFPIYAGAARNWPAAAEELGLRVDRIPEVGAVFVTDESSSGYYRTGHVGIILGIDGPWLFVREQNYRKLTVTEGWVPLSKVRSIIHPGT